MDQAMLRRLCAIGRDSRGATAVEYGLIVSLIFVAIVASVQALGGRTASMWGEIATAVLNAI
jgi:pilus assembly protein Flp/PilA